MIYVITMCFNTEAMMRASLKRFEETFGIPRDRFTHVFLHQHYPKGEAGIEKFLDEQQAHPNTIILDVGKNLGLSDGFNYCLSRIDYQPDDLIFAYDPDTFPVDNGWGYAMERVMKNDRFAWLTCWTAHTERETTERGFRDEVVNDVRIRITEQACLNSVSCFKGSFLKLSGGANEPNEWYGGFEIAMFHHLKKSGKLWAFLKDYREEIAPEELVDLDYREWKWVTTHGNERGKQIEFGEWLRKKGRL